MKKTHIGFDSVYFGLTAVFLITNVGLDIGACGLRLPGAPGKNLRDWCSPQWLGQSGDPVGPPSSSTDPLPGQGPARSSRPTSARNSTTVATGTTTAKSRTTPSGAATIGPIASAAAGVRPPTA